jgi:acyl-CoA reductase-like NAD-dependent aldehyde dehydrogenase
MTTLSTSGLAPVEPVEPPASGWELMYAGGGHEPVNGGRSVIESAIDGSVIATVPNADRDDLDRAIESAQAAAKEWAKVSQHERVAMLDAFADHLLQANERLGWLDTINAGMPITATRMEAGWGGHLIKTTVRLAEEIKGATFPQANGTWGYTTREPYGVVAHILPFNHPAVSVCSAIGSALATGNSVILKPSEFTPFSALEIGHIAQETLPPGLVSVLTGDGAIIGNAISEHPGIPRISFTGSIRTGRLVMRAAAEEIKHVTLELGGKGPLAILPDVDLELAVEMAVGGMNFRGVQAGQSCQSTSRVLVHDSMYDAFCERMVLALGQIKIGDPRDPATDMGALAFRQHLTRVRNYIDIGITEGARLLTGGGTPEGFESGFFVEPTAFADVDTGMRIANEEIFGPVMSIMKWSTEDELIEIANGVEHGLTARIACGDLGPGLRLANEIEAGRFWINIANGGPSAMPFGGFKHSGVGKTGDFESLVSYTREKSISVRL